MEGKTHPVDGGSRGDGAARARLAGLLNSPVAAYLALAFLQLKIVWGMWEVRDVTAGDTVSYFGTALEWFRHGQVEIVWSPLYTAFFGSFFWLTTDPAAAIFAHRLVIVFAASLLVLAVFRRVLPPAVAWAAAAWWGLVPAGFNTVFEVHLFAVLPVLVTWLLLSYPSRAARGAALAVSAAATVLVRNEYAVFTVVLGGVLVWWEWQAGRSAGAPVYGVCRALSVAYGVPLALAVSVCLAAYSRSAHTYPEILGQAASKNVFVTGQWYAVGYAQRHPEWRHDPWTEFPRLMRAKFGTDMPTLAEMISASPRDTLSHWQWNWELAPAGVQALLFDAYWGEARPDGMSAGRHPRTALVGTLLVLGLCATAVGVLFRRPVVRADPWVSGRPLVWLGMAAALPGVVLVITNVHPRPSYLYSLGVTIMAATGMSTYLLARPFWSHPWIRDWGQPVAAAIFLLLARPYYHVDAPAYRPVAILLDRLRPYQQVLATPGSTIFAGDRGLEAATYAGLGRCRCVGSSRQLLGEWPCGEPLGTVLDRLGVNVLYVDETAWDVFGNNRYREALGFLGDGTPVGWERLADCHGPGMRWRLFVRVTSGR